ncbi:MAG: hybrid sensor histidine kinase/response regulator [Betaproteobacteria bacterium]|uniref:histidine kinase n=1 Tax=Candidatus Proximibacter danicus TaxID=2954365 RepID=A0A9D7K0U1_9PROT|nr:hybrid sensor histidine kinase/response regulator [Candidatus Proximibacter danicus]
MQISRQTVFLVVDDFEVMRKVTSTQLRALGAEQIVTANNGLEALQILRTQPIDVVLSDWYMPTMSGLELLKAIRSDAKLFNLPFLMITAEAERERVAQAITSGVSDLLVKPYTTERLKQRLEKAMNCRPRAMPTSAAETALLGSAPSQATSKAVAAKPVRPPTILIVDDTPDNLHLLSHLFKEEYQVRVANNGEKALAFCCSDDPPDLVLLDIMMPGMDGFEVAQKMREHPSAESIPVIFVTAMTEESARLKGLELGAVDFVTKPIDPAILKPRVRNFMRYVALRKQLQADFDSMLDTARLHEDVEHITRHDIKGPLAGVIGLIQGLAADESMSRSTMTEQLHLIEETAQQVLDMINLSSQLFKIESGSFVLDAKPVNIDDLLRRIVEISRASFTGKNLNVLVKTGIPSGAALPQAFGDSMLCYSLLQNLVKNACEAAPAESQISVTVHDEEPLQIVVENKGAVPEDIRERFFDKFVTKGKQGGSGLGTYSAKLLAEAQGGQITLDVSDKMDTTTITVHLPRASAG